MCMRAGLYQQKNGLLVFLGSLRARKAITWGEISSSTVLDSSRGSGPFSLPVWFLAVPSEDFIQMTGRGGVMQVPSFGSTPPGGFEIPGIGIVVHGGTTAWVVGSLLISGKLTCCMASR